MSKKKTALLLAVLMMMPQAQVITAMQKSNQDIINNVVIFIDFANTNSFTGDQTKARQIENTFNDFEDTNGDFVSDDDSISLKSYIYDLTEGETIVESSFYPRNEAGTGYLSYKAPYSVEHYQKMTMGTRQEEEFLSTIINSVSKEIDLTPQELDHDGDGKVDSVTFIFSGLPSSGSSMLRPHQSTLRWTAPQINGKKVANYNVVAEGSRFTNIYTKGMLGTLTHEYLHMLDYPDLYKDGGSGKLVDLWDLMGEDKVLPQLPTVYSRNTYGNAGLEVKEINESGTYTLETASNLENDGTLAYKIKSEEYPDEYFMIEYRNNDEKWEEWLPGSGLIVYRIDESVRADYGNNQNGVHMYVLRPGDTGINKGDGDIKQAHLSAESGRTTMGTVSKSAFSFDPASIYHTDGTNSNIVISEVSAANGNSITFHVELGQSGEAIQGAGTVSNPYKISTVNHIKQMYLTPDKHFILANDIDTTGVALNPIGDVDTPFTGTLDGKGYAIKNATISQSSGATGFIGNLGKTGAIKNIKFENINVKAVDNVWEVGTVVGDSNGTIDNVQVTGTLTSNTNGAIGGIVGKSNYGSKIENSTSSVHITSLSSQRTLVGGIVGDSSDTRLRYNYADGKMNTHANNKAGALFGRNMITTQLNRAVVTDNVFNQTKTGMISGTSKVEMAQFGETSEGVVGVTIQERVTLDQGDVSSELVKFNNKLTTFKESFVSENTSIASVTGNKVTGEKDGKTNIGYTLTLGNNVIKETISVEVKGSVITPEPEPEVKPTEPKPEENMNPTIVGVKDETIKLYGWFSIITGIKAYDVDGNDISKSLKVIGDFNTGKPGVREITYTATDAQGRSTSVVRKITVLNER